MLYGGRHLKGIPTLPGIPLKEKGECSLCAHRVRLTLAFVMFAAKVHIRIILFIYRISSYLNVT